MKLKRMIAGFTAFATAVSTAIVMPVTASAADPFVALGGVGVIIEENVAIGSWGDHNFDLTLKGVPAAGATVTITLTSDYTSASQWDDQPIFNILPENWGDAYVSESGIDSGETISAGTSYTYSIAEDLAGASVIKIQGGVAACTYTVSVSAVIADEREEYAADEYDGSAITMTKSYPDWGAYTPANGTAQAEYKLTFDDIAYNEITVAELKEECKRLNFEGIEFVDVSLDGVSASDFNYCMYFKYGEDGGTWGGTSGSVAFGEALSFGTDSIDAKYDEMLINEIGVQINMADNNALPEAVIALKEGETFDINPAEPELQQYWLKVYDYDHGVVSLYDSEGTLLEAETDPNGFYNYYITAKKYHLTEKDEIRAVFESDEWAVEDVQLIADGDTIETFTTSEFTFVMPSADAILEYNCKAIDVPVEAIYIEEDSMTVNVGDEVAIDYYVEEEDHNDTIVWTSSNDTVVAVDDEGVITALKPGTATVTASATKCDATDSIVITVKAPLPAIKTAVAGDGQVTLTWNAIEGATKYAVYLYDGKYTCVDSNVTGTSYTVEDLTNGTKYGFKIKAYTGGWSEASAIVYATPLGNIVPQNVKAAAGDGEATITWDAVAGAQRYAVYTHDGESWVCLNSKIETNSYTVEELTNGTKYSFKVKTYAGGKWSAASAAASVVPNNGNYVPANVKAAAADSAVTVTWDVIAGAERYAVYIYENGAYTCLNSKIKANSYTVEELTNGTKYGFKVKACMNGKWSAASKMAYCVPNDGNYVPANVKATAGDGEATITWDAVAGAERYAVYIYENGEYTCLDSRINTNSYTAEGLTNDTKYGFKVKACMNGKWSAASRIAYATPFTIVPQNVSATYDGDTFAVASWDAVAGAEQYEVFLYPSGSNTSTSLGYANSSTISFIMPPLGSPVGISVKAYVNGVWSAESEIFYLYL